MSAGDLSALMCNAAAPVLPALRYGMNLQLANKPMPLQTEIPFRILSTCSWEQSPYTVKIYVPLHGVKTDLLRATFETNSLEVKAVNLQVRLPSSCLLQCFAQCYSSTESVFVSC